jgi:hypothetical protein
MNELQQSLIKTIDIMIEERFKELKFSYHVEAKISTVNVDGTYNVEIIGQPLNNIKARPSNTYIVGDIVYILIINGNFSNKVIDFKRP